MTLTYKIVELSIVTDETIEEAVNEWVARGWRWDGVRFVVTEASRRPSMAFLSFTRGPELSAASPSPSTDPPRPAAGRAGGRRRSATARSARRA